MDKEIVKQLTEDVVSLYTGGSTAKELLAHYDDCFVHADYLRAVQTLLSHIASVDGLYASAMSLSESTIATLSATRERAGILEKEKAALVSALREHGIDPTPHLCRARQHPA